jgi:hypothetical protein
MSILMQDYNALLAHIALMGLLTVVVKETLSSL